MEKRFLICLFLVVVIFLMFFAIRESIQDHNYKNKDIIKNYNFIE